MENITRQAYAEVYDIINHFDKDLHEKIPQSFINMIYQYRDLNYHIHIDYTKTINEQELLRETRVILSLIYRDYLCTKEQREKMILQDKKELEEQEAALREKYQINFEELKNRRARKEEENKEKETALIEVQEEKWYKKIITKILNLFKRKQ